MEKRKRKGFTLIELLATIVIVSLMSVVTIVTVTQLKQTSEEKRNTISIKNIQTSARMYAEEFKRENKYWFVDEESTGQEEKTEYACTTVGMLINKGFLKENILDTELNGQTIKKNTSVLIKRNVDTKVLTNDELQFEVDVCKQTSNIDVTFSVEGTKESDDNIWYNSLVNVTVNISNKNQIQGEETFYTLTTNGSESNDFTIKDSTVTINEEGRNINLCLTVVNLRDFEETFCLKEQHGLINIDKTAPQIKEDNLNLDNFDIKASGVKDAEDLTTEENIRYYLTYDTEKESKGNAEYKIDDSTRVVDKEIKVYVKDDAGNISDTITKKLNIDDAENGIVTSKTTYHCSLNSNIYSDKNDALNDCKEKEYGNIEEESKYYCDLTGRYYTTNNEAQNACVETENGTVTPETTYYCSLTTTEYSTRSQAAAACTKTETSTPSVSTKYYCSLTGVYYDTETLADANCTKTTTQASTYNKEYYCSLDNNTYSTKSAATSACTVQGDYTVKYSCSSGTLSGTKCYSTSSASEVTKYGLTCAASTTYGWSSGSTTSGLTSCSESSSSCSKSSHVGNTKVTCSSYEEHTKTYSTDDECAKYAPSNCSCDKHDGVGYYVMCPRYKKTTKTCQAQTGSKTYTGTTGGTTTGGCPSGSTATVDSSSGTCDGWIGESCTSSCSACCNETDHLTCSTSTSADKEYYCKEDGETYSSASSCKETGSVTSDTIYSCPSGYTLSSDKSNCTKTTTGSVTESTTQTCPSGYTLSSDKTNCTKTINGTISNETEYYCDLTNKYYSNESTAESYCTKTTKGIVDEEIDYICDKTGNIYNSFNIAYNNCYDIKNGIVTDKKKYYCDLNEDEYTTYDKADKACTNYCDVGTYYNNACYKLE